MGGNNTSRRTLLKTIAGTSTSIPLIGSAAADSNKMDRNNRWLSQSSASSKTASTAMEPMSDKERNSFFKKMGEKYDDSVVEQNISPTISEDGEEVGILSRKPSEQPGEILWDDTETNVIKDYWGTKIAECDNYAACYSTDLEDPDGKTYLFFWQWSAANSFDYWDWTGNLWNFYNHINIIENGNVLTYFPDGDISEHGVPIDVGVSASVAPGGVGGSASVSGSFILGADKVRPHPRKASADSNEYAAQWIGDYEGSTALNGAFSFKRDPTEVTEFTWDTHLKGGKYPKTI